MTTIILSYPYIKPRFKFGKQCLFEAVDRVAEERILPDPALSENYILRSTNHCGTQESAQLAAHEAQTDPRIIKDAGVLHEEGGWPKEVNPYDNEAVFRYRRRIERSDNWAPCLKNLLPPMEHCVLQNGSINIYDKFFDDFIPTSIAKCYNIRTQNSFMDPEAIRRPVRHLSWSASGSNRLAAAYAFAEFDEHPANVSPYSYVWDIENSTTTLCTLKSSCPIMTVEFNPRDPAIVVGGLLSGQVCCWDIRSDETPTQLSHPYYSHRYPAIQALWIPSKVNTEYFSASINGLVLWWDMRYPRKPLEILVMDLDDPTRADIVNAVGVTFLQYEQTVSSRFLAGLENGLVINVNRRGAEEREKLATRFACYTGPVVAIDRNPCALKNFLTIGNGSAKVWADDTKEGCFFSTCEAKVDLSGGCWSKSRCSVFFTINAEGVVEAYDVLAGLKAPLTSIHVCKNTLMAISPHEDGEFIAVGNRNGDMYVLKCSEDLMSFSREEKNRLNNYLERLSRYEKALDSRMKEIRLLYDIERNKEEPTARRVTKTKVKKKEVKGKTKETQTVLDSSESGKRKTVKLKSKGNRKSSEPAIIKAEVEYFRKVEEEAEKFEEIDIMDLEAVQELLKQRMTVAEQSVEDEESKEEDLKKDRKSIRKSIKKITAKSYRSRPRTSKDLEKDGEDFDSQLSETQDTKKRTRRVLQKICETEVCKPEVCCKDVEDSLKEKRLKEAQRYKMVQKLPDEMRMSLIQNKLFRKLTIQLDEIPELPASNKKRILMLKNAPPKVLRKELEQAKEEVRIWQEKALAKKLSSWTIKEKLSKKTNEKTDDDKVEKRRDSKGESSGKETNGTSTKQVSLSKESVFGKKSKQKTTKTELEILEEQERQELWNKVKQKAKRHDQKEKPEITYPRISAVIVKTSSEELCEKDSEVQTDT